MKINPLGNSIWSTKYKYFNLLALFILTCLVYSKVGGLGFVNFDDPDYILKNDYVTSGLTFSNIKWAFTTFHASNWHPVTWLSHMLDCDLFGLDPAWHHYVNVLLHGLNVLLVYALFEKLTHKTAESFFVAALFAIHPLHIESVAWLSERKDLLSTFFGLLSILFYVRWVLSPDFKKYFALIVTFGLSLMAKPMLVTLPFVLLLLDFWPLGRINLAQGPLSSKSSFTAGLRRTGLLSLVVEKIPLFILSLASCVITIYAQRLSGAVSSFESIALSLRIQNALLAWLKYIGKMFWPRELAIIYPYNFNPGFAEVLLSLLVLLGVSLGCLFLVRSCPVFLFGWLWYLGTLVPVIGIMQVGIQSMADRYTYIPMIGLFVMLVWGLSICCKQLRVRNLFACGMILILIAASICTWRQLDYWQSDMQLFSRAIAVTDGNFTAHRLLGVALAKEMRYKEAIRNFSEAIRIEPNYGEAYYDMGKTLSATGDKLQAKDFYLAAVRLMPNFYEAHNNLGVVLCQLGQYQQGVYHLSEALKINPNNINSRNNLNVCRQRLISND